MVWAGKEEKGTKTKARKIPGSNFEVLRQPTFR